MATPVSMSKRTVAVVLALILAALATGALISYVRGVENRTLRGAEAVAAYVAKDDIPAGMTGDEAISKGLLDRISMPRKVLAEGAIPSLDAIKGKVAAVRILKGEQLLAARFVAPADLTGVLPIPADRQAVAAEVTIPRGVGGFIQPGQRVSVIARLDVPAPGSKTPADKTITQVQFLLQDVPVLAVGQRVVNTPVSAQDKEQVRAQDKVMLTLALTPAEAEKLVYAILQGEVYFTLVPPGQQPVGTPGRNPSNVYR